MVAAFSPTIDAYAASDPAECFAVLSEYFFSAPDLLAERFPQLYERFCRFYRQDPKHAGRETELRQNGSIVH